MRSINSAAWNILYEDERVALSLQLGLKKSSWQAGEIMNKSHYKYLEIKYRAEKFLKMFTEYLELYDQVIPPYITGDKVVLTYFRLCIAKRLKPLEALLKAHSENGVELNKKEFNAKVIKTLKDWELGKDAHNLQARELVLEFDRWNNFRILPKDIQEPSAFQRRLKNSHKKHINTLTKIHPLGLTKLQKLYKTNKAPFNFLPLIVEDEVKVIKVKDTLKARQDCYRLGFYIFSEENIAKEYIEEVHNYQFKQARACKDGLEFWPKYRELIKKAVNYAEVQQITPSRKYLELALNRLQFI